MDVLVRKAYPSDLTDMQWTTLEPLIPPSKRGGRPREVNMREVINTIMYLNRTGCQWDMLPHDLLPKSTVYEFFPSGATMVHGPSSWMPCGSKFVSKTNANQHPARFASTANRSRPPRSAVRTEVTTEARKSRDVSGICSSIRWVCWWRCW